MFEDGREFVSRIGVVQLPVPDSAHGQEDLLVVGVSETKTARPDHIFTECRCGQCFNFVRLDDRISPEQPIRHEKSARYDAAPRAGT
jgi:hypothetical protein